MSSRTRQKMAGFLIAIVTILGAPRENLAAAPDMLGKLNLSTYPSATKAPPFSGRTTTDQVVSLARVARSSCLPQLLGHLVSRMPNGDADVPATAPRVRAARAQRHRDQCPRRDTGHPEVCQGTRLELPAGLGPEGGD